MSVFFPDGWHSDGVSLTDVEETTRFLSFVFISSDEVMLYKAMNANQPVMLRRETGLHILRAD